MSSNGLCKVYISRAKAELGPLTRFSETVNSQFQSSFFVTLLDPHHQNKDTATIKAGFRKFLFLNCSFMFFSNGVVSFQISWKKLKKCNYR
jgi:hypothetical protein